MKLCSLVPAEFALVPYDFIDKYMAKANGEFVKVYLCLLRLKDEDVSVSLLADRLEMTEKDVTRALKYWESQGLLGQAGTAELSETAKPEKEDGAAEARKTAPAEKPIAAPAKPAETAGERRSYPADALLKLQAQEEFAFLITAAEQYLSRTLTRRDTDLLAYLYDELKLPGDLLEYLVEYCVERKPEDTAKAGFLRYMESVALGWHSEGIRTLQQAKDASRSFAEESRAVMKAFGISGRVLTEAERKRVTGWRKELGMSTEMIRAACERTMEAIHEPSFPYAEKILKSWQSKGFTTPEAVKAQETNRKPEAAKSGKTARKSNFTYERVNDYDAILREEE